jgi:hypothetical protein
VDNDADADTSADNIGEFVFDPPNDERDRVHRNNAQYLEEFRSRRKDLR